MKPPETFAAPVLPARTGEKWRREQQAFCRLLPELLRSHAGQFVAIHEGRVVESGDDKPDVARRAYARFGYIPIFVSKVSAGPMAPVRLPTPRLPSGESSS
jgi:hypothetical protein